PGLERVAADEPFAGLRELEDRVLVVQLVGDVEVARLVGEVADERGAERRVVDGVDHRAMVAAAPCRVLGRTSRTPVGRSTGGRHPPRPQKHPRRAAGFSSTTWKKSRSRSQRGYRPSTSPNRS